MIRSRSMCRETMAAPSASTAAPNCQVAVFSEYGWPELRFVRGGTLDEPSSVSPDVHIYTKSKLPWIELPDSTPAFDVYYDRTTLWPPPSNERIEAIIAQRNTRPESG